MSSYTAISHASEPKQICIELSQQLPLSQIDLIIIFCSSSFNLLELGAHLKNTFSQQVCAGCTTAGEFNGDGYTQQSVVAVGFDKHYFKVVSALINDISDFSLVDAKTQIDALHSQLNGMAIADVKRQSFIMSLVDGLSAKTEAFLSQIDSALSGMLHFGGSAGDDETLHKTFVFYEGKFYSDAAIILMFNTVKRFSVFSVNHIDRSMAKLVVTDADPNTRQVFEINGEPAAQVYAAQIGKAVDELNIEDFATYPMAVKVGDDYYIRSIQQVCSSFDSLSFYCAVDIGIVLNQISLHPINQPLIEKIHNIESRIGPSNLILGCDCFLRRTEIGVNGHFDETAAIQKQHNIVGFNAYGEHIQGIHLNQTFTGVYISESDYVK